MQRGPGGMMMHGGAPHGMMNGGSGMSKRGKITLIFCYADLRVLCDYQFLTFIVC